MLLDTVRTLNFLFSYIGIDVRLVNMIRLCKDDTICGWICFIDRERDGQSQTITMRDRNANRNPFSGVPPLL